MKKENEKIDNIFSVVEQQMALFNETMKSTLNSENRIIKEAIGHVLSSQGKQVRPLLTILSASLHGTPNEKTYIASSLIELTHCASLIHDDIVDEAYMRRNMLSMYAIWRNKNSVLIGDYIFSRAIKITTQHHLYDILARISAVIEQMSIGELEQSEAALRLDITEQEYYSIIQGKTAELISACAYAGASTVSATEEQCRIMSEFGSILGMIFQIKDDLLDYCGAETGKILCNDIKEKKITLPLIYALNRCNKDDRKKVMSHISRAAKSDDSLKFVHGFAIKGGGIEYCNQKLLSLSAEAKALLSEYPDTPFKRGLFSLIDYFIERTK